MPVFVIVSLLIDKLIHNYDIILYYKIASELTKGEIPCVISRGNYNLRGLKAENLSICRATTESYYTFRAGCIWGMLVDTGEVKDDDQPEYGGAICYHGFRLEQENMIKNTIKNASKGYEQEGIKYKLIVTHLHLLKKILLI